VRSLRTYSPREPFPVGDFLVTPLPIPHDTPQVSLRLSAGGHTAALATDLGEVPPELPKHLQGAEVLLMEANHDLDLLWSGPYLRALKRRVASPRGHLSNAQTCALLRRLSPATGTVVLMHLSETNNRPALARDLAAGQLKVVALAAPDAEHVSGHRAEVDLPPSLRVDYLEVHVSASSESDSAA
jgi:phosphoribosyl 1,2-cyclic phosphodiesterase